MDSPDKWKPVSEVVWASDGKFYTTHMDLAVYVHMLHRLEKYDLPLLDVVRIKQGQHRFFFGDPGNVIRDVEVSFANGRDAAFADAQRSLKRITRAGRNIPTAIKRTRTRTRTHAHHSNKGTPST